MRAEPAVDLALRMLGDSLAREVIRSACTTVLVISGRAGEGRTTLTSALAVALRALSPTPVHRLSMREVHGLPEALEGGQIPRRASSPGMLPACAPPAQVTA